MSQKEAVSLEWDSRGCLNDFGVGHDTCVFSEIGFWSSLYVLSLGGRLLNPTKPLWAWTDKTIRQPHAQPQSQPKIYLQIRQVKIKMITNGHDFSSWKLQTKIYHWTWMHSCWKKQSMEWQMLTLTMSNQWNQAASLLKSKQNSNAKISWRQPSYWAIYP